jgi:hypothetical protein
MKSNVTLPLLFGGALVLLLSRGSSSLKGGKTQGGRPIPRPQGTVSGKPTTSDVPRILEGAANAVGVSQEVAARNESRGLSLGGLPYEDVFELSSCPTDLPQSQCAGFIEARIDTIQDYVLAAFAASSLERDVDALYVIRDALGSPLSVRSTPSQIRDRAAALVDVKDQIDTYLPHLEQAYQSIRLFEAVIAWYSDPANGGPLPREEADMLSYGLSDVNLRG